LTESAKTQAGNTGFLSLPILRDATVVALIIVVGWKLLNAEIKFDLTSFSFNDFLSLVLALFSVALSVAFYFKANDASNQFYDNTYKFTKDMSEILGRIEAGFGERLRHLDEGYSGMRDRLDKLPHYDVASIVDVKKEEEEIQKKEAEQKAVIEDLAEKAKLAEHEKRALFSNLAHKSSELDQAKEELRQMQESRMQPSEDISLRRNVLNYAANVLKMHLTANQLEEAMVTSSRVQRLFDEHKSSFHETALQDMRNLELLDSDDRLNRNSAMLLRATLRRSI
jgi:hypothetical protein